MAKEFGIEKVNLEVRLSSIEPRLPNGVRKHIRRLKEQGKLLDALKFKQAEIEKKSAKQKLEDAKNSSLKNLIYSGNAEEEAVNARKLTLILNKTGEIEDSEREADLFTIHKNWPEQGEALRATELSTMDEIARLSQEASNS